jgi:homoserine kinase type II
MTPWLEGNAEAVHISSSDQARPVMHALADFHRSLQHHERTGPSPGLLFRIQELEALMKDGLDRLSSVIPPAPRDEFSEMARRWLGLGRLLIPASLPAIRDAAKLPLRLQPCIRDARPGHFLFDQGQVRGLIDFGAMGVESVACDLARLLGEWSGLSEVSRAETMACYEEQRPLNEPERAALHAFELVGDLLIGSHWITWRYLESRRFPDPRAFDQGLQKGLDRLVRRSGNNRPGTI